MRDSITILVVNIICNDMMAMIFGMEILVHISLFSNEMDASCKII